jgi:4,5-dihydroxyphthalate decarboxylase
VPEPLRLRLALGRYPHTAALLDGAIAPEGIVFDDAGITSTADAFKRMCREVCYDVSEMSITGYLLARVYGTPFTALPVFPARGFPQSHVAIVCRKDAGISTPRDLEGRSVGARAYTGTASLWVRGVLQDEYGVDISKVTWLSAEEEHVLAYQNDAPANVTYDLEADITAELRSGRLAAAIGIPNREGEFRPLLPNAREAARDYYARTGVFQINHCIVIRDALLQEHPWLARSLYDAFVQAKDAWLATNPDVPVATELSLPNNDPFPYGLTANAASIDALLRFAHAQRITPTLLTARDVFPLL